MSTSTRVKAGSAYERGEDAGYNWDERMHVEPLCPRRLTSRQKRRWRAGFQAGREARKEWLSIQREKAKTEIAWSNRLSKMALQFFAREMHEYSAGNHMGTTNRIAGYSG